MGNADIALRHITRRRPEELACAFVPRGCPVEVLGWIDTQVTNLERRLDEALRLRVAGKPRVLHVEFFIEFRRDVPYRVFEYTGFLVGALRAEAPRRPVPPIQSIAVVLSGRRRRWPARGAFRTSCPDEPFSGKRFRIDAVYQRTVAELRARGSVLWLVFTPLARDATAGTMREVIAAIGAATGTDEERAELYVALLVMAEIDPWGHHLREEIAVMIEDEDNELFMRVPFLRNAVAKGREEGQKQGREEVIRQLLGRLLARRIGRRPTPAEKRSLVQRAETLGAERVEDTLLDLDRDALVRWMAEPLAPQRAKKSAAGPANQPQRRVLRARASSGAPAARLAPRKG